MRERMRAWPVSRLFELIEEGGEVREITALKIRSSHPRMAATGSGLQNVAQQLRSQMER